MSVCPNCGIPLVVHDGSREWWTTVDDWRDDATVKGPAPHVVDFIPAREEAEPT